MYGLSNEKFPKILVLLLIFPILRARPLSQSSEKNHRLYNFYMWFSFFKLQILVEVKNFFVKQPSLVDITVPKVR